MRLHFTYREEDDDSGIKYDEQIIINIMDKLDERTVEEFMREYSVSEYEARRSLAEMTYVHNYIR